MARHALVRVAGGCPGKRRLEAHDASLASARQAARSPAVVHANGLPHRQHRRLSVPPATLGVRPAASAAAGFWRSSAGLPPGIARLSGGLIVITAAQVQ